MTQILDNLTFLMVHLSLLSCVVLFILTSRRSQRSQIRAAFYALIGVMFVWDLGTLLDIYWRNVYGSTNMLFINMCYFGICFIPVAILFLGVTISHTHATLNPAAAALLVIPATSFIVVCTNEYHRLFFVHFSIHSSEAVYGPYYYFHSIYSYGIILVGLTYLISFTFRNSGAFSRQSLIIVTGLLFPLVFNVLYSFSLFPLSFSINASAFTVTIICFAVAFLKYDFLQVAPIAIRKIVDLISDAYLVVDSRFYIVDHNQALRRLLPDDVGEIRRMKLEELSNLCCTPEIYPAFLRLQAQSAREDRTVSAEYHFVSRSLDRHLDVEITPIRQNKQQIGSILLLKDVTQAIKDMKQIRDTQAIMIERERLASLGQMIGGIAHNLKTPILSIAGGIEALRDLSAEYRDSVGDPEVTPEDHREISGEMNGWLDKMKAHCTYISDVISTVKGQAVQFSSGSGQRFSIDEFMKRVDLLMRHELKRYHCTLHTDILADPLTQIAGDINSLVQIFDNLIINAIHAYEGKHGEIHLSIRKDGDRLVFTLADYGAGIPPEILPRLFKEMVTTKGKNGTGLGLYLSYSNIKGHFGGRMEVQSVPGEGTVFTIFLPALPAAGA